MAEGPATGHCRRRYRWFSAEDATHPTTYVFLNKELASVHGRFISSSARATIPAGWTTQVGGTVIKNQLKRLRPQLMQQRKLPLESFVIHKVVVLAQEGAAGHSHRFASYAYQPVPSSPIFAS